MDPKLDGVAVSRKVGRAIFGPDERLFRAGRPAKSSGPRKRKKFHIIVVLYRRAAGRNQVDIPSDSCHKQGFRGLLGGPLLVVIQCFSVRKAHVMRNIASSAGRASESM